MNAKFAKLREANAPKPQNAKNAKLRGANLPKVAAHFARSVGRFTRALQTTAPQSFCIANAKRGIPRAKQCR